MYTIIGAGLTGLAIADHFKKNDIEFEIYEGKEHGGGHVFSEKINGFTWDEGPHVSFAKTKYVKDYFATNCQDQYLEFDTNPSNYYKNTWIPHPAQSHLYAVPESIRYLTITEIKKIRSVHPENYEAKNYKQWLTHAFGESFTEHFPETYTIKYWTTSSENLSTDWIGDRVYFPNLEDVLSSAKGPLSKQTHYISKIRYPKTGGFYSFIKSVEKLIPVQYNKRISFLSFENKEIKFEDGTKINYENLVSTIPLVEMILKSDAPEEIKEQAGILNCSQLLLVNVIVNHATPIPNEWVYVYDKEMYSTRINFTELLSPENGAVGKTGIQVEVYFSAYREIKEDINTIAEKVLTELIEMKLIERKELIESYHTKWINWANVIFDNTRRDAQNIIFNWLATMGLTREYDDLEPMTNWDEKFQRPEPCGQIILAGRFAQWKYFWTEDCVLRALFIAQSIVSSMPANKEQIGLP